MKALVIWESMTGTTRKAAGLIAAGLREGGIETRVSPATDVDLAALSAADLVVLGSWTDGLVFVGQKPGRQARLWHLPYLTGKQAFVYCTYAVDAGHAVDKLADIATERGAHVLGSRKVHRFHLPRDCAAVVAQVLDAVPAS
ncbi:MAG: FAD-dependent pyridine nucleotide-disulfide oxidoreductase [Actinomycetia bacterium]|nr:FAD-dependent pyridine nucleotide-disulfide oxidoreductase [Actinomycetes bacterium]